MPLFRHLVPASTARRASALAGFVALSATLTACAPQSSEQTDDLTGAKGEVQDVIQKLADRADRGDAASICRELFTASLRASLERGGTCADNVEAAINNADYTTLDVKEVRLGSGTAPTTATAIVRTIENENGRRQLDLTRATATAPWQINGFSVKVAPTT